MTAGRWQVLIAHAEDEEAKAEELAEPIRAAGYEVAHRGTVQVGESIIGEASKVLALGGPVVVCATVIAVGTGWANEIVQAARQRGAKIFVVRMEQKAHTKLIAADEVVAEYWKDPEAATKELIEALQKHYPLVEERAAEVRAGNRRQRALTLADTWFKSQLQITVENAGTRYTPELNVGLPITAIFDGLGRTPAFFDRIQELHSRVRRAYADAIRYCPEELRSAELPELSASIECLLNLMNASDRNSVELIDFDDIDKLVTAGFKQTESYALALDCLSKMRQSQGPGPTPESGRVHTKGSRDLGYQQHHAYELRNALVDVREFLNGNEARLANVPVLLLCGQAGMGKTHLLCDVARLRQEAGRPTVMLLGEQFSDAEPWAQILGLLGLSCTREEFLQAIQDAAQSRRQKALLIIDALNEGEGRKIWPKHLAGWLALVAQYPWIAVALSVRTSYEDTVVPAHLVSDRLCREVHQGFARHEYEAAKIFFENFGIKLPSVPLLNPEFKNPLFLKLICTGLRNRGMSDMPAGLRGITSLFRFLIDSINDKISRPEHLDFDPKSAPVLRALDTLASSMAKAQVQWLPRESARQLVDQVLPRPGFEKTLFRYMLTEGLLAEDRFYAGPQFDERQDGVRFSYERLADHLIVKHLLDAYLNLTDPSASFAPGCPLGQLVANEASCYHRQGWIEALTIQVPERVGQELPDLAPHCRTFRSIWIAVVKSLIWREPGRITTQTKSYIDSNVPGSSEYRMFINALLTIACSPEHPLNADILHKILQAEPSVSERDAWWSIVLHGEYGQRDAVDRIVEWAWSSGDKAHIDEDSIELCAVTLTWFLTTSNRFLRDRATKALVNLLTDRFQLIHNLLVRFRDVDDVYIIERLYAVAYGCVLRSRRPDGIKCLARYVYDNVFTNYNPIPHILLRDYARGIIEAASFKVADLNVDVARTRPPYRSSWPDSALLEDELKTFGEWHQGQPDEQWARVHLHGSIMDSDDFARYVIGTDMHMHHWSSARLEGDLPPTTADRVNRFEKSLTKNQRLAWSRYRQLHEDIDACLRIEQKQRGTVQGSEFTDEQLHLMRARAEQVLRKTLGKKKSLALDDFALRFLREPYADDYEAPVRFIQRWMLTNVIERGWTVEKVGSFDRAVNRYEDGRSAHKVERIGKKYQWIALHEILARMSDNFRFRPNGRHSPFGRYEGPWQLYRRDIDPSCVLTTTRRENWQAHTRTWWFTSTYDAWKTTPDDEVWVSETNDLPDMAELIEVQKQPGDDQWLVLDTYCKWEDPLARRGGEDLPRREIWYSLQAYVLKVDDLEGFLTWAAEQELSVDSMPKPYEHSQVFLGEIPWSLACRSEAGLGADDDGWTNGDPYRQLPVRVLVPNVEYQWEGGNYDCSIDSTIIIKMPSRWLHEALDASWTGNGGDFVDRSGRMVAMDPSVTECGPSAMLVRRDAFLASLAQQGLCIVWTVIGEKQVLYPSSFDAKGVGWTTVTGVLRFDKDKKLVGQVKTRRQR